MYFFFINNETKPPQALAVPWLAALKSSQFWLGNLAAIGNDWGFHTFFTMGPTYMKTALGFDLKEVSEPCGERLTAAG